MNDRELAQRLIEADERVKRATRRAFPNGECSYDPEWQAAVRALDAERKESAILVARAYLRDAPEADDD